MTRAVGCLVGGLLVAAACGGAGQAAPRDAPPFASLPDGVRFPEGVTANPDDGDIYVGTFDVPSAANADTKNKLLRFDRDGALVASHDFGRTPLLGLAFDAANRQIYITNVGDFAGGESKIQRIGADLSGLTDVATIPAIGPPEPRPVGNPDGSSDTITFGGRARVPNALAFDRQGDLYVSDSFQGAIFRIANPQRCAPRCDVETFSHDPLLATAGVPPFAANGLAFSPGESALFIANTGDDRVLKVDMASETKQVSIFAENINGADGLAFDHRGRLWVAANQADEVVALSDTGLVVAKLGGFRGVGPDGTPEGLLFPASVVIVGNDIVVTNLAAPITEAAGDEPEEDVTRWTVSRLKLPPP